MDITQSQPRAFERATSSSHPLQWSVTNISRAPVRYNLPPPPPEIPKSEAELEDALKDEASENTEANSDEAPRSLRPGQKGFAERLMSKYGWTKGSGLGAGGTGIVNPLRVRIEKQKKKPDSEGGGFVGPGGRGKIIGSKKATSTSESEGGKWGVMSEVVVLRGMLNGLDVDAELDRAEDGGLMQEIGDECGEKVSPVSSTQKHRCRVFLSHVLSMGEWRGFSSIEGTRLVPLCLSNSQASYRL